MPRTIESMIASHKAAQARIAEGKPVWEYTVRLADVWRSEEMSFEQRRDAIVTRIRASLWFRDRAALAANRDEDGELAEIVDRLAEAEDIEDFDGCFDEIYDIADGDRAWIATF